MRSARFLVAILLLITLAGFAVWRLGGGPRSVEPVAADAPRASATSTPPVAPPVTEADPVPPTREAVVGTEAPAAAPVPAQRAEDFRLHGRVIAEELNGREVLDAQGQLTLGIWGDSGGLAREVEFEDGAWSLAMEGAGAVDGVSVESVRVGSRATTLEEPTGRVGPPYDVELVVRVRLAEATILRVVDAASGADLAGVSLVRTGPYPHEEALHPGLDLEGRVIARDLLSPVSLDEHPLPLGPTWQARFLVGAQGYAWTLVEVDQQRGGERVVVLERAADLTVHVRGVEPRTRTQLQLRRPDRAPPVTTVDLERDDSVELSGLAPGSYRVSAEVGEWIDRPLVLGQAQVELIAGARAELDLVLEAPPVLETADAGGTIFVAKGWGVRRVRAALELLATPLAGAERRQSIRTSPVPSAREGFDAFRWEREGLQTGRYELALDRPPFSAVVELPSGGRDDLDVVVPPPAELSVLVVDGVTGDEVVTDELMWSPRRPEGSSGGVLEPAQRDPRGGGYLIRAPAGEIDLMLWAWEYQPYSATVDLGRGVQAHTIRLERGCGLVLRLVDGETPIAFPTDWYGALEAVEGSGHRTLVSTGPFERKLMVSEPGTYLVDLPEIPGYATPPA